MLGRELHTTLEIEEEERPRLFTLRALNSPVPFRVRHGPEPSAAGTRLHVSGGGGAGLPPGSATVLVVLNQTTTSKDNPDGSFTASAVNVGLKKVDGNWLISAFDPV